MRLLRHCAAQAAAVGQPQAAARTLRKITQSALSLAERAKLQDEIISYLEVGGDPLLQQQAIRERIEVGHAMGASKREIRELEFRHLEVELQEGTQRESWIPALVAVLTSNDSHASLRTRAGIRLLVASDMSLDESLARSTYTQLREVLPLLSDASTLRRRAELIHETVFGDQDRALELVRQILNDFPEPTLEEDSLSARRDAGYALSRLGRFECARPVLLANYQFMLAHHVLGEAAYALALLGDNAICVGNVAEAVDWIQRADNCHSLTGVATKRRAGVLSAKASLAIDGGRIDEAEAIVDELWDRYPVVRTPRLGAVAMSLRMRIKLARGDSAAVAALAVELQRSYERGSHLGGQDHVVEALWCAAHSIGNGAYATKLLAEYLNSRRREKTPPEASLRTTTASDPAWGGYLGSRSFG
jgi:hypothetical protein